MHAEWWRALVHEGVGEVGAGLLACLAGLLLLGVPGAWWCVVVRGGGPVR